MTALLDHDAIRGMTPAELSAYITTAITDHDWQPPWESLIGHINAGLVPPNLIHVFLCQCRHPGAVVAALRQQSSKLGRKIAITHFGRWSRRDHTFNQVWDAVNGTHGLMLLMASLSVVEVELLCRTLHLNCKDNGAQAQRREQVTKVYNALTDKDSSVARNPDRRPLMQSYHLLVPACTSDVVLRTITPNKTPKRSTVRAHLPAFQRACWDAIFAVPTPDARISSWKYVIDIDINFAFKVLEKLVQSPAHVKHNASCIVESLVFPLASRLTRRRDRLDSHVRLYDLFFKCIDIEPSIAKMNSERLTTVAVRTWRGPQQNHPLDRHLQRLLSMPRMGRPGPLPAMRRMMRTLPPPSRFPLLKLSLKHRPDIKLDLDDPPEVSSSTQNPDLFYWPAELLHELPSRTAWQLFEKVRNGGVSGWPVDHRSLYGVPRDPSSSDSLEADMEYFSTCLASKATFHGGGSETGQWLENATRIISVRKNKAAVAREPNDRERWARSAIDLSIATGEVETFAGSLQWARRFNKDPLVGHKLLSLGPRAADILSAVPDCTQWILEQGVHVDTKILQANRVVMQVLETAAMLSREPGFDLSQVSDALRLHNGVVSARLRNVGALIARELITDDWAQRHVWAPTTSLLLDIERFLLGESHTSLGHGNIAGPLGGDFSGLETGRSRHVCWFLDRLAKERDLLWREHRARQKPATVTLPTVWPRGLAVQQLFDFDFDGPGVRLSDMPYYLSRLQSVVFATDEGLLKPCPADEEVQDAIGPFVDSYRYALDRLVNLSNQSQRAQLVAKAWEHATTTLTANRMSPVEATLFWKKVFREANISPEQLPIPIHSHTFIVQLPPTGGGAFPVEWNPQPTTTSVRELASTCLDCMLQTDTGRKQPKPRVSQHAGWDFSLPELTSQISAETSFRARTSETVSIPSMWNAHDYLAALPLPERDALAVAAISLVNARCGLDSSPFLKPYPSTHTPRIPALYLEEEFLEAQNKILSEGQHELSQVMDVISRLSVAIPNDLLVRLARSLLTRMEKEEKEGKKDPYVQAATLAIIKRLNRGDCPSSALEFVRHIVLDRQEDSSWHRHLLDRSLLRVLSADDAKMFFRGLAAAIEGKLQEQRRLAQEKKTMPLESGKQATNNDSLAPVIKISTVKMIAQILRWADFIDRTSAFKILSSMLNNSTHPDVVICIVESLLQQRTESSDVDVRKAVVGIIADNIVPLAGSLDERAPFGEEAWKRAEAGESPLPEIYSASQGRLPPLMKLLSDAAEYPTKEEESTERQEWMERVIIPTLRLSAKNHMRWTRLFLQHNGLSLHVLDLLPPVPAELDMLLGPFEHQIQYMPSDTTNTVARLLTVIGAPPFAFKNLLNQIRQNKDLAESDAGKHFLNTWYYETSNVCYRIFDKGVQLLAGYLKTYQCHLPPEGAAGMTVSKLQNFIVSLSEELIRRGDLEKMKIVQAKLHMSRKSCPVGEFPAARSNWDFSIRPVLESILAAIKSYQAQTELRRELNRLPCTPDDLPTQFPDTFWYRSQFIQHTHERHAAEAVSTEEITACADALLAELDDSIEGCKLHDAETRGPLEDLCSLARGLYTGKHLVMLALRLGTLETISPSPKAKTAPAATRAEKIVFQMRQNMQTSLVSLLLKDVVDGWWSYLETEHDMVQLELTPETERDDLAAQTLNMLASWRASDVEYVRRQADAVFTAAVSSTKRTKPSLLDWLTEKMEEKGLELEKHQKSVDKCAEAAREELAGTGEEEIKKWTEKMKSLGL